MCCINRYGFQIRYFHINCIIPYHLLMIMIVAILLLSEIKLQLSWCKINLRWNIQRTPKLEGFVYTQRRVWYDVVAMGKYRLTCHSQAAPELSLKYISCGILYISYFFSTSRHMFMFLQVFIFIAYIGFQDPLLY